MRTKSRSNGYNGHNSQNGQGGNQGQSRQPAGIDELTGVWNRAGFVASATPMFRSCQRRGAPIGSVLRLLPR